LSSLTLLTIVTATAVVNGIECNRWVFYSLGSTSDGTPVLFHWKATDLQPGIEEFEEWLEFTNFVRGEIPADVFNINEVAPQCVTNSPVNCAY